MQAVILAGGLGTRLRPLTYKVPKVMVKVGGKEFLFHLIQWLEQNGVDDIVVCASYLWKALARKLEADTRPGVKVRLSIEDQPLGTAGAVKHAESLLDEEFFLINGDTYLPIPYGETASHWNEIRMRFDCLLVVYSNLDKIAPNDTSLDDEGVVVAYSKRDSTGMKYVNAGLAMIKRSVFEALPPDVPLSLEQQVFPDLISRRRMAATIIHERYYDIGTPDRLRVFEEYLEGRGNATSG